MSFSNNKKEILLEAGTNEFEIMEFIIAGETFGINVAKIREIMMYSSIKPMPNSHPAVEGVFKPRDILLTVINLPQYLGLPSSTDKERDIFMITNFNGMHTAFHVHSVVGIARISWEQISKPDPTIYGGLEGVATGIANYDNRLITILDFEKIIWDISPSAGIQLTDVDVLGARPRNEIPIVIAEDSMLLSKLITESLHKAGYINTTAFCDGKQAWDYFCEIKEYDEPIVNHAACLITDIEMPQMDGHRLTKLVKDDFALKDIPIIIFSSLINDEMRRKGVELGANAQITKPEIVSLVGIVDDLTTPKFSS